MHILLVTGALKLTPGFSRCKLRWQHAAAVRHQCRHFLEECLSPLFFLVIYSGNIVQISFAFVLLWRSQCVTLLLKVNHVMEKLIITRIKKKMASMSPPGPLCYCWPPSWLRLTPPPDTSLGLPGRWELRAAAMASAATSDGWPTMCLPSGCQVPACTSWPLRTSSTRPWRWVVLFGLRKVVFLTGMADDGCFSCCSGSSSSSRRISSIKSSSSSVTTWHVATRRPFLSNSKSAV